MGRVTGVGRTGASHPLDMSAVANQSDNSPADLRPSKPECKPPDEGSL